MKLGFYCAWSQGEILRCQKKLVSDDDITKTKFFAEKSQNTGNPLSRVSWIIFKFDIEIIM